MWTCAYAKTRRCKRQALISSTHIYTSNIQLNVMKYAHKLCFLRSLERSSPFGQMRWFFSSFICLVWFGLVCALKQTQHKHTPKYQLASVRRWENESNRTKNGRENESEKIYSVMCICYWSHSRPGMIRRWKTVWLAPQDAFSPQTLRKKKKQQQLQLPIVFYYRPLHTFWLLYCVA